MAAVALSRGAAPLSRHCQAADRDVGDVVACECAEQLAGVERHRLGAACSVARIMPARSSDAVCSS